MVYSFSSVSASIVGAGGAFSLGSGNGNDSEGISITMSSERDVLKIGADGTPMRTLKMDKSGKVTVHLLRNSPVNSKLAALYNAQALSPSLWGSNTITLTTPAGDVATCRQVAFTKLQDNKFGEEAQPLEWEFSAGIIDQIHGTY